MKIAVEKPKIFTSAKVEMTFESLAEIKEFIMRLRHGNVIAGNRDMWHHTEDLIYRLQAFVDENSEGVK